MVRARNMLDVVQGEGLLAVVKVIADWMRCNATVIKTCAQVRHVDNCWSFCLEGAHSYVCIYIHVHVETSDTAELCLSCILTYKRCEISICVCCCLSHFTLMKTTSFVVFFN